jgi:hypothetical protein
MVVALCAAMAACSPVGRPALQPAAPALGAACAVQDANSTFRLDRAALLQRPAAERLVEKLDASPYHYFRALGPQFALRTCAEFRDVRSRLPSVAIHGDAHVGQFVVTPSTAGLEDFDHSGFGPAVIDIVRYAASIHLACREVSWPCRAEAIVEKWLAAYREALDHAAPRKVPAVVARLRANSPSEPAAWLAWADGLMRPLSDAQERSARAGWMEFRELMIDVNPARAASYYDIIRLGMLQMGIGSGLATKVLFRLRGASDDSLDDVVVEARSTMPSVVSECSTQPMRADTMWPLLFTVTLGSRMPDIFGTVILEVDDSVDFWVQSWVAGYRELSVSDLGSEADLFELAQDAARQLAGHFWTRFPEPLRATQRHLQLRSFDLVCDRARTLSGALAEETFREWRRFRGSHAHD